MRGMLKVGLALAVLAGVMCGCDGGGGGGGGDGGSGLGNVSGTYSFSTDTFDWTSTDGSSGSTPAVAFNAQVTQDGNTIVLISDSPDTPGFVIIDESEMTGLIESDGSFIANSTLIGEMAGIPGRIDIRYTLEGQFTDSGWAGDYTYVASVLDEGVSFTYVTRFRGDKQPVAAMISSPADKNGAAGNTSLMEGASSATLGEMLAPLGFSK